MNQKLMLIFPFVSFVFAACTSTVSSDVSIYPPNGFQESDLFGAWIETDDLYSSEELNLRADHTFSQYFELNDVEYIYQGSGTWEITKEKSGCVYIHLYGMKFFYQVFEIAENGNKFPGESYNSPQIYWDPCEEKGIEMVDKTVLVVSSHPVSSNGIILRHMSTQREGINRVLEYAGK